MITRLKQILTLLFVAAAFFFAGYSYREMIRPYSKHISDSDYLQNIFCPSSDQTSALLPTPKSIITPTVKPKSPPPANFTGPELFEAINDKRVIKGVNKLGRSDELCSIASFRLNQLLPNKTIDNHAGFIALTKDKDSAFAWIFDKYNIAEFLIFLPSGSAQDAVAAWENTLGHQKIITGGEFTIGCAYAQAGIGVALAGY